MTTNSTSAWNKLIEHNENTFKNHGDGIADFLQANTGVSNSNCFDDNMRTSK